MIQHNRAFHTGKRFGQWLNRNAFWLLAALTGLLAMHAVFKEKTLAAMAFGFVFILCTGAGVFYANRQFTQNILTEYDKVVQRQQRRRGLRVIKGGRNK